MKMAPRNERLPTFLAEADRLIARARRNSFRRDEDGLHRRHAGVLSRHLEPVMDEMITPCSGDAALPNPRVRVIYTLRTFAGGTPVEQVFRSRPLDHGFLPSDEEEVILRDMRERLRAYLDDHDLVGVADNRLYVGLYHPITGVRF